MLIASVLLSGCYRLSFTNGSTCGPAYDVRHCRIAFRVVEVGPLVGANNVCSKGKWTQGTTQDTPVTAISASIDLVVGIDV